MAKDSQSAAPVTQWLQQLRSYLDPPPRGAADAPPAMAAMAAMAAMVKIDWYFHGDFHGYFDDGILMMGF